MAAPTTPQEIAELADHYLQWGRRVDAVIQVLDQENPASDTSTPQLAANAAAVIHRTATRMGVADGIEPFEWLASFTGVLLARAIRGPDVERAPNPIKSPLTWEWLRRSGS